MITVKFSYHNLLSECEEFQFKSYKEFFFWYLKHCEKGAIYGVEDDGNTE